MSAVPALTLEEATVLALDPALALLPCKMDTPPARVQLLTTALQESRLLYRRQIVNGQPTGPAKSLLQAEKGGGLVHGVRLHPQTRELAAVLYTARGVRIRTDTAIWNAIERDDVLAFGLGRLLLYTDPYKLPALGRSQDAWELYTRTWRPGQPRRDTWDAFYERALAFVTGADA